MKKELKKDYATNQSDEKDTMEGKISENFSNDSNRSGGTPEEGGASVLGTRVLEVLEVLEVLTNSLTLALAHFFINSLNPRIVHVINRSASD